MTVGILVNCHWSLAIDFDGRYTRKKMGNVAGLFGRLKKKHAFHASTPPSSDLWFYRITRVLLMISDPKKIFKAVSV